MPLRVITARLNGSPSDNAVLNGALSLSKAFGGHIDALFAQLDSRVTIAAMDEGVYPSFYEEMVAHMEREWTEVANKALKNFEKWRVANNVRALQQPDGGAAPTVEWRDAVGTESETIGRKSRISDIVVTAMPSRRLESRYDLGFEAVLLDAGRPILLMPEGNHVDVTTGKVIVAWNGSAEAFRAVTAAMPILAKADEVLVYTAAEGDVKEDMAQDDLVTYLKWQGVRVSVLKPETGKANTVEEALLAAAKKAKASLLVMGAYTHSRFRELMFGGVTRHVLSHATMPVLMAH